MTYTITTPDQTLEFEGVGEATDRARELVVELGITLEVIHTSTGAVAFVTSPAAVRKVATGEYFKPWERVETPGFEGAPHFDGFKPAYQRKRIAAVVYSPMVKGGAWRVYDGRTQGYADVATTKLACALTREMRQGRTL